MVPQVLPSSPVQHCLRRYVTGAIVASLTALTLHAQIPGRNVNMVSGADWPNGDPLLQRQNEPSIAASTRNPLHLVGGANDYRTVDLPGLPGDEVGDAWLGLFHSLDGGQRWTSTLLPGYPQDLSPEGMASPIKGYQAGADPVVRAGTSGLFYYAGLTFDRTEHGKSAIFVARFIDNNNLEAGNPVKYLGTHLVATDPGSSGGFLDKPWLAVDIPRARAATCRIETPGATGPIVQRVAAGHAYVAYAHRTGSPPNERFDIFFAMSRDCGASWTAPIRVSRQQDPLNQGATIAINPLNGTVYIAWRRFDLTGDADAMLVSRYEPSTGRLMPPGIARVFARARRPLPPGLVRRAFARGGLHEALESAGISPFDQTTSATQLRFRTNAYPTLAIDGSGRLYMAWTERGYAAAAPHATEGDTRILLASSSDGVSWTAPQVVSDAGQRGHQIMPALAVAGGRLMVVYYDLQEDRSLIFTPWVDDRTSILAAQRRHTIDIRAALGTLGAAPVFAPSVRVSDYIWGVRTSSGPLEQMQVNPPNLPMFKLGTAPFIGDYVDLAPSPSFVLNAQGQWVYNTQPSSTLPVFHAAWTDNRDVRVPLFDSNSDGNPWNDYTPPAFNGPSPLDPSRLVPVCVPGNAGSRNQNVYTARITGGLIVGSPANTKPLSMDLQRGFVVFAQNTTSVTRVFRMTILNQPPGGRASFDQFPLPPYSASSPPPLVTIDVTTPARSTAARTVYVTSTDPDATIRVDVSEIPAVGAATETPGGLEGVILLNPELDNPELDNPELDNPELDNPDIRVAEVYNPELDNPELDNPELDNPELDNPELDNPELDNIVVANPELDNTGIANPELDNPELDNPELDNPELDNPELDNALITDVTWKLTNTGNTTAAYNVNVFLTSAQTIVPSGTALQLIIYKTYKTPVAQGCDLKTLTQNVLVANIANPELVAPDGTGISEPNDPDATHATLWLAPGEEGRVTLRIYDTDPSNNITVGGASIDPALVPEEDVTLVLQPQAVNTVPAEAGVTEPPLVSAPPAAGPTTTFVGQPYQFVIGAPASVTVRILDSQGAALPGVSVSLAFGVNPTGATLAGSGPVVSNAAGLAIFPAVSIDRAGAGYTLIAQPSGGAPAIESAAFAVYEACVASGVATTQRYHVDGPVIADRPKLVVSGVDWENDGFQDVAVVTDSGVFYTMHNFGGGFAGGYNFATGTGGMGAAGAVVGDFTGDGHPDLAIAKGVANSVVIAPLVGGFASGSMITLAAGDHAVDLAAGHFNGDTHLDLAVLRASSVRVFFGSGGGNFPTFTDIGGMGLSTKIATADLDGDGDLDLVVGDSPGAGAGLIHPVRNDGGGVFTLQPWTMLADVPAGFAVRDFNGDNRVDVAVMHAAAGTVTVLYGDGAIGFAEIVTLPFGFATTAITAGDYNSDGRPDLALTRSDNSTINIVFGQSAFPYFGNLRSFATDPQPVSIATADLNGDGRADLITANRSIGSIDDFNTISVLLGSCGAITANLSVTQSDSADPVQGGDPIVYTATVTNNGPFEATSVSLVQQPSGTAGVPTFVDVTPSQGWCVGNALGINCALGTLAPGASAIVTMRFTAPPETGTVGSTVIASAVELDLVPANNDDTELTTVNGSVTYFVTNSNNSGAGSLRQAILDANAHAGRDKIFFAIAGPSPHTITPTSLLPTITDPVILDASSQLGYAGTPVIELNGTSASGSGLTITAGNSEVRGFAINRFTGHGILLTTGGGNLIEANRIGVNPAGTIDLGNGNAAIKITDSSGNLIGGPGTARNVLSGNNRGVWITNGTANTLANNYIGLGADGGLSLGNSNYAVVIDGTSTNNDIGIAGGGNVISGNLLYAVVLYTTGNRVRGNLVGTNAAGTLPRPNQGGVADWGVGGNTIGGLLPGEGNVLSGNTEYGLSMISGTANNVVQGNRIGTNAAGDGAIANGRGVLVAGTGHMVGGAVPEARNLISGNTLMGVYVVGPGTSGNVVAGNYIGVTATGTGLIANGLGIKVENAPDTTIGGLTGGPGVAPGNVISGNAGHGIEIVGMGGVMATGPLVRGNIIGLDPAGSAALGNSDTGVSIRNARADVGDGTAAGRNVISANSFGVVLSNSGTTQFTSILGNYIGTDATGMLDRGNSVGIQVGSAPGTRIGSPGAGNLISGNGVGIHVDSISHPVLDGGLYNTVIQGNSIGTNADHSGLIGNSVGVRLNNDNNLVGGTGGGQGNKIVGSGVAGVAIVGGVGGHVVGNSIDANGTLGIDIGSDGVTANDAGDADGGPNGRQNFPVITAVVSSVDTVVSGTLNSTASAAFTIHVYSSPSCNPSGNGEGRSYRGSFVVTTDGAGDAVFAGAVAGATTSGHAMTLTATNAARSTSEFSACVAVP